jgi:hypothetical protein
LVASLTRESSILRGLAESVFSNDVFKDGINPIDEEGIILIKPFNLYITYYKIFFIYIKHLNNIY